MSIYDNSESTFWMVWNPARDAPTVRHEDEGEAIREAERLAKANRGQRFFVLQATHLRVTDDMKRVRLAARDELPF